MSIVRTATALGLLAGGVLPGVASAQAPTGVRELGRSEGATQVATHAGAAAWSERRRGSRRYRLKLYVGGRVSTPDVASQHQPFDVDLGPDSSGSTVAVYSRCSRVPKQWLVIARGREDGCRLFRYSLRTRRETPVRTGTSKSVAYPAIWRDRLVFTAVAPSTERLAYQVRLSGRPRARRLPVEGPARREATRHGRTLGNQGGVMRMDIRGDSVAALVSYSGQECPDRSGFDPDFSRVMLANLRTGRLRTVTKRCSALLSTPQFHNARLGFLDSAEGSHRRLHRWGSPPTATEPLPIYDGSWLTGRTAIVTYERPRPPGGRYVLLGIGLLSPGPRAVGSSAAPDSAREVTELQRGEVASAVTGARVIQANVHHTQQNPYELRVYSPSRRPRAVRGFGRVFAFRPVMPYSVLWSNWAEVAATPSLYAVVHVLGVVDEDGTGGRVYPELSDLVVARGTRRPARLLRCRGRLGGLVADGRHVAVIASGCGSKRDGSVAHVFDGKARVRRFSSPAGESLQTLDLAGPYVALGVVRAGPPDPVTGNPTTEPARIEVRERASGGLAYSVPGRSLVGGLTSDGSLWLKDGASHECGKSITLHSRSNPSGTAFAFDRCVSVATFGPHALATTADRVDGASVARELLVLDPDTGAVRSRHPGVHPADFDGRRVSYFAATCSGPGLVRDSLEELASLGPYAPAACPAVAAAVHRAPLSAQGSTTARLRCPRGCRGTIEAYDLDRRRPIDVEVGWGTPRSSAEFSLPRRRGATTINLRLSGRPRRVEIRVAIQPPGGPATMVTQRLLLRHRAVPPSTLRVDLDGDGTRELVRVRRSGGDTRVVAEARCRGSRRTVLLRRTPNAIRRMERAPGHGLFFSTHDPLDLDDPGTGARIVGLTGPCGSPTLLWSHPYDHSHRGPAPGTFDVVLSGSRLRLIEEGYDADRYFWGRETTFRPAAPRRAYVRVGRRGRSEPAEPLAGLDAKPPDF